METLPFSKARVLTFVHKFDNLFCMNFTIEYFHSRVKAEIEDWPEGILADFAHMVELLMEFGRISACRTRAPWEEGFSS